MSIESIYKPLLHEISKVGSHMQASALRRLMGAVNALYEATFDDTAIGGASQIIQGHNHDTTGGGAMSRGLSWSEDFGVSPLLTTDFSLSTVFKNYLLQNQIRYIVSPKLDNNGVLSGWVLYSAKDVDIDLEIREVFSGKAKVRKNITLPLTYQENQSEALAWAQIQVPLGEGSLNKVQLEATVKSYEEDLVPVFKIYSLNWAETPGLSYQLRGEKI